MAEDVETRLFSLNEARQTLPLVEPIVDDLMECHRRLKERRAHREKSEEAPSGDVDRSSDGSPLDDSLEHQRDELTSYLEEIYALGAEFQGFSTPRIHFPARHENRIVYLCWKPDDGDINHWHETYADCENRNPVEDRDFSA